MSDQPRSYEELYTELEQAVARLEAGDLPLEEALREYERGVALASHVLKAGTRAVLNGSPEPFSNWIASVSEDALVIGALALAFSYPWLALGLAVTLSIGLALLVWWLCRKVLRGMARLRNATFAPRSGRP